MSTIATRNNAGTTVLTIDDPAYFDRLAEVEAEHWWSHGMWRIADWWFDAALHGRYGLHALDVGCGTGLTAVRLARRSEIDRVVGLDPSPAALTHARRRHGFPLVLGSALALPFGSESFDVLTCFDVLQHLPAGSGSLSMAQAADELRRVLRPGGIALVRSNSEPVPGQAGGSRLEFLRSLFLASGFNVRRASHANCLPAVGQELRARLKRGNESGRPTGGGLKIELGRPWINRLLGGVAATEAFLAGRLAARLPYGHSTMILAEVLRPEGGSRADRD
jgi:SAM-dependent methyltransferase